MDHPTPTHPDRMSHRRSGDTLPTRFNSLPTRLHSLPLLLLIVSLMNLYLVSRVNGEMSMYREDIQSQPHLYQPDLYESEEREEREESVGSVNCTRCSLQSSSRARRLVEIKADILNKLGLKSAPNITIRSRELSLPPLQNLLRSNRDSFGHNSIHRTGQGQGLDHNIDDINMMMAGDQPIPDDDDDFEDFYVSAEKSLSIARNRK